MARFSITNGTNMPSKTHMSGRGKREMTWNIGVMMRLSECKHWLSIDECRCAARIRGRLPDVHSLRTWVRRETQGVIILPVAGR